MKHRRHGRRAGKRKNKSRKALAKAAAIRQRKKAIKERTERLAKVEQR